jgi:hypothetical protein
VSTYTDDINPYKQWHMRRAFRMGWEAADKGADRQQAAKLTEGARLNRITLAGWWRGFNTQRDEY